MRNLRRFLSAPPRALALALSASALVSIYAANKLLGLACWLEGVKRQFILLGNGR